MKKTILKYLLWASFFMLPMANFYFVFIDYLNDRNTVADCKAELKSREDFSIKVFKAQPHMSKERSVEYQTYALESINPLVVAEHEFYKQIKRLVWATLYLLIYICLFIYFNFSKDKPRRTNDLS